MKFWIIISTKNAETNRNAFRLANFCLQQNDEVKIFLMWEGVDYQLENNDKFDIEKQVDKFLQSDKAEILACGTCIEARHREGSASCPIRTMKDLYEMIKESDKVVSF
jgi:uncharacterized protein involved in oxidation of intracellular sulfur